MLAFVLFGQGVSAQEASKDNLNGSEKEKIKENFNELGIDQETQNVLIEKLENGEKLDSMKEENLQKAANDVQNMSLNDSKTITFADGSKIVYGTKLEDENKDIQPMASTGSHSVKSYWNTGVLNYSFHTDFVIRAGKNNDYIQKSYNPSVTLLVPGGSYSGEKVTVERKNETSTKRAYSRMDFKYSVPLGGSSNVHLYFNVGNNTYETTLSQKDSK